MASSYDNDLRLNEQGTGDNSGSWGTVTNLNLEMIAEAFSYGTRAIANAPSDNITLTDGALDADRSMYLRLSGGGQACTVTFLPATISKVWLIENATSATLTMKQGSSPAGIAIPAGQVKMIATDGGGSTNGVVYDLLTDVNLAGTTVMSGATIDDVAIDGKVITMTGSSGDTATLTVAADGALAIATTDAAAAAANISITADGTFTATGTTITLDSAGDIILDADGADVIFKDGGTAIGTITNASSDLVIKSNVQDKDILLKGDDGGTEITALSLDMSAGGNALFSGTVTRDLTRGSIDVGNSSGVSAPLAAGGAGTILTSDGTDLSFAAAAAGGTFLPAPKYVSNWASPSSNYTSSGTWSKGSLDGNTTVWVYLISGGQGGNSGSYAFSGNGGTAVLLCGWADLFDGGTYVVGAGGAGLQSGTAFQGGTVGGNSTFTLSSANGSAVFTATATKTAQTNDQFWAGANVIYCGGARADGTNNLMSNVGAYTFLEGTLPTVGGQLYNKWQGQGQLTTIATQYIVFGGGMGATTYNNGSGNISYSLYAGNGGPRTGSRTGVAPGGGGGSSYSASDTGGNGGAGSVRIYHVS